MRKLYHQKHPRITMYHSPLPIPEQWICLGYVPPQLGMVESWECGCLLHWLQHLKVELAWLWVVEWRYKDICIPGPSPCLCNGGRWTFCYFWFDNGMTQIVFTNTFKGDAHKTTTEKEKGFKREKYWIRKCFEVSKCYIAGIQGINHWQRSAIEEEDIDQPLGKWKKACRETPTDAFFADRTSLLKDVAPAFKVYRPTPSKTVSARPRYAGKLAQLMDMPTDIFFEVSIWWSKLWTFSQLYAYADHFKATPSWYYSPLPCVKTLSIHFHEPDIASHLGGRFSKYTRFTRDSKGFKRGTVCLSLVREDLRGI